MYYTTIFMGRKCLTIEANCSKVFLVDNKIVKYAKKGAMIFFPENTEIAVGKILHHEKHKVSMAKNKSILYHNSVIEQAKMRCKENNIPYYDIPKMQVDEDDIILSSLEIEEKI